MNEIIQVTKLDASKRQLEVAIDLFFLSCDPISIHTLTSASYNILRDHYKKDAQEVFIKNEILKYVKENMKKRMLNKINEAENFFKHADRDINVVLDFRPKQTEYLMWEATQIYYDITKKKPDKFNIYNYWFAANHKNLFVEKNIQEIDRALDSEEMMDPLGNKQIFYRTALNILGGE